ncbi:MAG: CPBP family intramembrane metalloprotease, partial [Pseudonocardia sp.]|nr:CPBP family intramembrane metalloprotease [Pseudonocardia sp.]
MLAFLLSRLLGVVLLLIGAVPENVQGVYADAGSGGVWSVLLSLLFLAVLTPLGEELAFRGVVTTAPLRFGALIGVVGSAVVFAVMHGFNAVPITALITALIVGLITGEARRRSGSIWPGFAAHVVKNALAPLMALLLAWSLGSRARGSMASELRRCGGLGRIRRATKVTTSVRRRRDPTATAPKRRSRGAAAG